VIYIGLRDLVSQDPVDELYSNVATLTDDAGCLDDAVRPRARNANPARRNGTRDDPVSERLGGGITRNREKDGQQ
jgi:hypothetical protein